MTRQSLAQRYWDRLTDGATRTAAPPRRTASEGYTYWQRYWASLTGTDLLLLAPRPAPPTGAGPEGSVETLALERIEASLEQIFLRLAAPNAGIAGAEK